LPPGLPGRLSALEFLGIADTDTWSGSVAIDRYADDNEIAAGPARDVRVPR
jgi:hypothetical protein